MICFFCATPYHVMICLNMALYQFKQEKKCLVVYNHFEKYQDVCDVCAKSGIFERVVIVKTNNLGKIENWNRRYHTFFLYRSLKRLCNDYEFKKLIFFVIDPLNVSFVIKKVLLKNPLSEICVADDGLGTYLTYDIYQPKGRMLFWLNFLKRKQYYDQIKYMYVIQPELLTYKPEQEVRRISLEGFHLPEYKNIVSQIFGNEKLEKCDYLLLQQPYDELGEEYNSVIKAQKELFLLIDSFMVSKKAFIKLHPRSKPFISLVHCLNLEQKMPLELMFDEQINNCTIITVDSTAAFTPYLLYGYKPRIILLYGMCKDKPLIGAMEQFIKLFIEKYTKNGGFVYVPKTIIDLRNLLVSENVFG